LPAGKSAPPPLPLRGFTALRCFHPIPSTLPFTAPAAASIIAGVTALSSDDIIPLPSVLVRFAIKSFGWTTPKPVVEISPFKTSPIIPSPFLGRPLRRFTPSPWMSGV